MAQWSKALVTKTAHIFKSHPPIKLETQNENLVGLEVSEWLLCQSLCTGCLILHLVEPVLNSTPLLP